MVQDFQALLATLGLESVTSERMGTTSRLVGAVIEKKEHGEALKSLLGLEGYPLLRHFFQVVSEEVNLHPAKISFKAVVGLPTKLSSRLGRGSPRSLHGNGVS